MVPPRKPTALSTSASRQTADLPNLRYDLLPELQMPGQLNLVHELLDRAADRGTPGARCCARPMWC
jgi:hypothetical protein